MNLSGRLAIVTGSTGNIGRVMAETLAELGADLMLVDRPGSSYEPVVAAIASRWPVGVEVRDCDLESSLDRKQLIGHVRDTFNTVHILVNNAAFVGTESLAGWAAPFEDQSIDTWRRAIEVNLTAVFDLSRGLAPLLRRSGNASVINVASIYGSVGPDYALYEGTEMGNPAAYAASKGGLIQLTRWLAATLAPDVRVNSISPGGVFRRQDASFVRRYEARTPLGRMACEDDLRGAVAFLASDLARYVTGHDLKVDGGWTAI